MSLQTYYLIWEDLEFHNDEIRIRPGRIGAILQSIPFRGSMPSLNAIRQEYFVRHYNKPIKLTFEGSRLSREHSPTWVEINALIEKAIEVHRYSTLPKTLKPAKPSVKKKTAEGAERAEAQQKPDYLKVLATLQSPRYRLITIKEKYQGQSEESHIYRCETLSGRLLIIWENTKAARAAYLFIADEATMADRLSRIEAFIHTEDILFKRSRFRKLKENKDLRAALGFIGAVKHEDSRQFETEIRTYLNRY